MKNTRALPVCTGHLSLKVSAVSEKRAPASSGGILPHRGLLAPFFKKIVYLLFRMDAG